MDFFVNYGQKFNYTKAMSTNTLIAPHLHPHYELYLCFEPIIRRAILNGQEVPLNHSCAILYAPYSVHSNIAENSAVTYTRYSIYFGKEFLSKHHNSLCDLPILRNKNSYIFPLTDLCESELQNLIRLMDITPLRSCRQELLLVYILRHLYHYSIRRNLLEHNIIHINSKSYISDVLQYIAEHIDLPLTISDLSSRFFVSKNKLQQDFKAFTGIPVHQFVVHVKISVAKYELQKQDFSIQKISCMLGFENELYFFPFFKSNTGCTPLQWAKKQECKKEEQ